MPGPALRPYLPLQDGLSFRQQCCPPCPPAQERRARVGLGEVRPSLRWGFHNGSPRALGGTTGPSCPARVCPKTHSACFKFPHFHLVVGAPAGCLFLYCMLGKWACHLLLTLIIAPLVSSPQGRWGLVHPAPTAPSSSQGLPPQVRASSGQQLPGGRSCSWLRHPSLRAEAECRELVAGFPLCHQGQRGGGWQEASPQAAPSLQSPPLLPGRGKGRGALLVPGLFPCCLQTVAPQEHSSLFYR